MCVYRKILPFLEEGFEDNKEENNHCEIKIQKAVGREKLLNPDRALDFNRKKETSSLKLGGKKENMVGMTET